MSKVEPFDRYRDKYEAWFEKNKLVYRSEIEAVGKLIPRDGIGLEVGVGTGRFSKPFNIRVGIDPSREMARAARENGIHILNAVGEDLPFIDGSFDFVLMVTTICFLDDVSASFKETSRVLKPNGYFLIGFVDKESVIGKSYQDHKNESVFYRLATFFSVDEILLHLRVTGFHSFEFVQTIFHDVDDVKSIEPVKRGYGEGSFVVIRAQNRRLRNVSSC
ncbi:MAG: class I SAM-dependent methyltransferase [Promethearchaeota archaeon]